MTSDLDAGDLTPVTTSDEMVEDAVVEHSLAVSDIDAADLTAVAECNIGTFDLGLYKASSCLLAVDLDVESANDERIELVEDGGLEYDAAALDLDSVDPANVTVTDEQAELVVDAVVENDVAGFDLRLYKESFKGTSSSPYLLAVGQAGDVVADERVEWVVVTVMEYPVTAAEAVLTSDLEALTALGPGVPVISGCTTSLDPFPPMVV